MVSSVQVQRGRNRNGTSGTSSYNCGMDIIKIGVVLALLGIIASMGSALFALTRSQGNSRAMVRALTVRVALSVGLFLLLLLAWRLGYIQPHGLR